MESIWTRSGPVAAVEAGADQQHLHGLASRVISLIAGEESRENIVIAFTGRCVRVVAMARRLGQRRRSCDGRRREERGVVKALEDKLGNVIGVPSPRRTAIGGPSGGGGFSEAFFHVLTARDARPRPY